MGSTRDKVKEAQKSIVDRLAKCEEAIAELYEQYVVSSSSDKQLWEKLAREERKHAAILRSLHGILDKGNIFLNIGRFGEDAMSGVMSLVRDSLASAQTRQVHRAESLAIAAKIESSLLESRFYEIVTGDAQEFHVVAARMTEDTKNHIMEVQIAVATMSWQSK